MTSLTRSIWGREFNLSVRFEDLDEEGIEGRQWDAYGRIISGWSEIDGSLARVMEYCLESNPEELAGQPTDNIFRYVIPKYLFIPQDPERRVVALMCDYRFDPEHGIAVVFEDENLASIGPQDIVL